MGQGSTFGSFQDLAKALKSMVPKDQGGRANFGKKAKVVVPKEEANMSSRASKRPKEKRKRGKKPNQEAAPPDVSKKGGKLRVKITKEAWEAIKSTTDPENQLSSKTVAPNSSIEPGRAKAAFQRITELVASSTTEFEAPPTAIPEETAATLQRRIALGARWFETHFEPDEPGIIVGFDFGTSSAKIAVRDPMGLEDDLAAIEAPIELQSMNHPYLWRATVWFNPESERFSLYPQTGCVPLAGFKTGIIGGTGNNRVSKHCDVTRVQAAIAYLALHTAQVFGCLQDAPPFGAVAPAAYLRFNIGVPVAAIDNSAVGADYKRIVAAAFKLIPYAWELDLTRIKTEFAEAGPETPDGFDLVPELAAAIAGYSSQKTARTGAHLLIDVGASTLDMVTFLRVASKKSTGIESSVELLGAAALEVARRSGEPQLECELACRYQYKELIDASRQEHRTRVEFKSGREVQIIATGGGCNADLHDQFIKSRATKDLLGEVPIILPSPPAVIAKKDCDAARLLLAYGLTMDVFEKVELLPPSKTPDMPAKSSTEIVVPGAEHC